jgi:hypothetical protein
MEVQVSGDFQGGNGHFYSHSQKTQHIFFKESKQVEVASYRI